MFTNIAIWYENVVSSTLKKLQSKVSMRFDVKFKLYILLVFGVLLAKNQEY